MNRQKLHYNGNRINSFRKWEILKVNKKKTNILFSFCGGCYTGQSVRSEAGV